MIAIEEKLTDIIEDIWKTIPRLKEEVLVGSKVKKRDDYGVVTGMIVNPDSGDECVVFWFKGFSKMYFANSFKNEIEIVGKNPTIIDMLEWLDKKGIDAKITSKGYLNINSKPIKLNLSNLKLEHQTETLINTLYDLLRSHELSLEELYIEQRKTETIIENAKKKLPDANTYKYPRIKIPFSKGINFGSSPLPEHRPFYEVLFRKERTIDGYYFWVFESINE